MHRKDFPAPNMHIFRLGEDGWNSPHFLQSTHRSPWKGISQILPLFQTFIKFSLGNDSTNSFGLIAGPLFSLSAFFFLSIYNLPFKKPSIISDFFIYLQIGISALEETLEEMNYLNYSYLPTFIHSILVGFQAVVQCLLEFFSGLLLLCRPLLPLPFNFPFQIYPVFLSSIKHQGFLRKIA